MSVLNEKKVFTKVSHHSLSCLPPNQTVVQDAYFAENRPLSQISNNVPLEFRIAASNTLDNLDLHGSQLYVKLKVTKSDSTSLDGSSKVGHSHLYLQSLFSRVESDASLCVLSLSHMVSHLIVSIPDLCCLLNNC